MIDPEADPVKAAKEMIAPIYAAGENEKMAMNQFKEVITHAEMIRLLQGPVYEVERNHHFEELVSFYLEMCLILWQLLNESSFRWLLLKSSKTWVLQFMS